jgi:undecaprenyl-diphosphatase
MDALNQFELQILLFIREYLTNPFLDFIMPKITFLADDGWFWIVLAIICLIIPKTRKTGAVMGLALIFGLIVCNLTLKPIVARIRPYDLMPSIQVLVDHLSDFSFPSGHTVASFEGAFAIFLTQKKAVCGFGIAVIADEVDLVVILRFRCQAVKRCGDFACFRVVYGSLGYKVFGKVSGSGERDRTIGDNRVVQRVDLTCNGNRVVSLCIIGSGNDGSEVLSAAPIDPMRVSIKNVLNATKNTCWKRKKAVIYKFISVMPDYGRE